MMQLGVGGMEKVYKAYDPGTNRFVAIKVLNEVTEKKRFLIEARAMAKLSHPNIVTIYQINTESSSGFDYIVMELIEGKTPI